MLSSVNLPGGVQRRKLESDELQMRNFFEEGDLVVAEVQAFFSDGVMSLHTRSLRYGKLRNGQLVTVPPILVRRLKSHFVALPCGVDLILSLNGYIWVSKHAKENEEEGEEGFDAEAVYSNQNDVSLRHCDLVWFNIYLRKSMLRHAMLLREFRTSSAF